MRISPPPLLSVFGEVEAGTSAKLGLPVLRRLGRLPCCLLRTGEKLCTLIISRNSNSAVHSRGKRLMIRPPGSMKVGRPKEARSVRSRPRPRPQPQPQPLDFQAVPLRREGGGGERLPLREVWRATQVTLKWRQRRARGHPGPWPPTAAPAQTLDSRSNWSPPPSFGSQLPGPGILRLRAPRIPRWLIAPKPWPGGRIPSSQNAHASPPPQPDPRALPRILGLCSPARPQPYPCDQGPGRGLRPGATRLPDPLFPGGSLGPSSHPSGAQASPTHDSGVWERWKAESSPRGLNPLNALPEGGWRA